MNFATALLLVFLISAGAVGHHFGWIDPTGLLDVGMILVSLAGLAAVLKLPWDLYFEAGQLRQDQEESEKCGIEVTADEKAYAIGMKRRLLLLCLSLHVSAAALLAGTSYLSGGRLGYYFAVFFLISTFFRPLGAFYSHVKCRLVQMRQRTRYPREDVKDLCRRVGVLEHRLRSEEETLQTFSESATEEMRELRGQQEQAHREQRAQAADYDEKVERVCREFTRSIESLTEDRELLHGLRAFVRMVKET